MGVYNQLLLARSLDKQTIVQSKALKQIDSYLSDLARFSKMDNDATSQFYIWHTQDDDRVR